MSSHDWKSELADKIPPALTDEINVFEKQLALRKQDKLDEAIFAETRLRRGAYGQRYDNGQRHDGVDTRQLDYPSSNITKGPSTLWDAPGMQRIKVPYGGLEPQHLEVLADLAEEYSDDICHVTTRQGIQLHFVQLDDIPELMRRLAAAGITTREACGNSVRNVTACSLAGVCDTQAFDVSPYADALASYLLGHDDTQGFGRKFKITFSGCAEKACGLTTIHDLGFIAQVREEAGKQRRGFAFYVGGGLGAVPYPAKLFDEFLPEEELLPMALAVCRVFTRLGAKRNRARARLKFVVKKLGIDAFRTEVLAEREKLRPDARWTDYLENLEQHKEAPLIPVDSLTKNTGEPDPAFESWRSTNTRPQPQAGYSVVTVGLPLGDATATQMRALADLARKYTPGTVRTTVEQNITLRWVRNVDLPAIYSALSAVGLGQAGAGTIVDITACPGTDTCKLGIASSRGLARTLSEQLSVKSMQLDEAIRDLRIKVSGCFNSCGQHHIADIGFWGVSRKINGYTVPHFQTVLGGQWSENGKSYGLAIGAIPSRNIPAVVERITDHFVSERTSGESFQTFFHRIGKAKMRATLEDLFTVPSHEEDPSYYSDWGDPREFTIGDLGVGECAGEVVSYAQFGLATSERLVFEAQERLELDEASGAVELAYRAMLEVAKALCKEQQFDVGDEPADIVAAFRTHLFDTEIFFDPYAKGKFGSYLFRAHDTAHETSSIERARQRIEEAQLFIEAAHSCYGRMVEAAGRR